MIDRPKSKKVIYGWPILGRNALLSKDFTKMIVESCEKALCQEICFYAGSFVS